MSIASIKKALNDALATFATAKPIAVAWESTPFTVTSDPYLSASMSARTRVPNGYGRDAAIHHSGIYQINVFYPSGSGTADVEATCDELIAAFYRGRSLATDDGKQVTILNAQARPAFVESSWVSVPLTIEWFSYE